MVDFAAGWDSFYVIVGAAAGALIGLQFVVITLIADRPPEDAAKAGAAFATPTIVHFSVSLLLCALLRVPWPTLVYPMASWGVVGAGGLIYTGVVAWRMREQTAYRPGFEDWAFHLALPAASYALLAVQRVDGVGAYQRSLSSRLRRPRCRCCSSAYTTPGTPSPTMSS